MKQKVINNLNQIDARLEALFQKLGAYDNDLLNKKPAEGEWSPMDVLHHLMRSERLSHGYIRKKLSYNPNLKKAGLGANWRAFLLSAYLKLPLKWKAPAVVSEEHFPEYSTLQEVSEQWRQQRHQLKQHLEELPGHLFDKELYKHPFAGKITIAGMIDFFGGHMERHSKQIDRALEKLKK